MPSSTTIRVCDPTGVFLFETAEYLEGGSAPGLRYVLSAGNIGTLLVTLPPRFNDMLPKDGRIHVMRSVNGGPAVREGGSCFLIRRWEYADDYTLVTALHVNDLMRRRFFLYDNAFDITDHTGYADNLVKEIWQQNMGNAITVIRALDTGTHVQDRTVDDWSALVSVQPDLSLGATVTYNETGDLNVLDIIHVLCDMSYSSGVYLLAEIVVPTDESSLELQTFIHQRGQDRRAVVFAADRGNLANAILTIDAIEEYTFAESLGGSPKGGRLQGTARDDLRIYDTPFGRIETIFDMNDATDATTLTHGAQGAVQAAWPKVYTTADLQETDQCIRGVHYDFGDYVTVEIRGVQYSMRLNLLDVAITAAGETTKVGFRQELEIATFP